MQYALKIEIKENKKIKPELEKKLTEIAIYKKEFDNLKDIYENKIEILNNKLNSEQEKAQEYKHDFKVKNEVRSFYIVKHHITLYNIYNNLANKRHYFIYTRIEE